MDERTYPEVADAQGGVFTRREAATAGWGRRQLDRLIATGRWRRVAGAGLTALEPPDPAWRRAWAALLSWPDAVVGGADAARLHGLPVPLGASVIVYTATGRQAGRGLVPVRRRLERHEVAFLDGAVLTSPRTTIDDCLALLPFDQALDLVAWLVSRGELDRGGLAAALRRRFGRPGAAQLERLLRVTRTGATSVAELRLHQLLTRAGLRGWRSGVPIVVQGRTVAVVDVLFEAAGLIIEVDGRRAHSGQQAFVADRRRQNTLVNLGFRVLRFTWWDLTEHPDRVVAEIRAALAR